MSKKNVSISDTIISTKDDEQPSSDSQSETTVRKRHKHKPASDSEPTLKITKKTQNIDQTASGDKSSKDLNKENKVEPSITNKSANVTKTDNTTSVPGSGSGKGDNKSVIKVASDNRVLKADTEANGPTGKTKKDGVKAPATVEDPDAWSQNQQVILERALKQYPRGTDQRWEKVAGHIPGKTKVCVFAK